MLAGDRSLPESSIHDFSISLTRRSCAGSGQPILWLVEPLSVHVSAFGRGREYCAEDYVRPCKIWQPPMTSPVVSIAVRNDLPSTGN